MMPSLYGLKAARLIHDLESLQAACELLAEAIEELESDGKLGTSGDIFRQTIGDLPPQSIVPLLQQLAD